MIRFGTFNIHYFYDGSGNAQITLPLNQTLRDYQPDIIGFQEVASYGTQNQEFYTMISGLDMTAHFAMEDAFCLKTALSCKTSRLKVLSKHASKTPGRRVVVVTEVEVQEAEPSIEENLATNLETELDIKSEIEIVKEVTANKITETEPVRRRKPRPKVPKRFAVASCHLDPRNENLRVEQIKFIARYVAGLGFKDHILLGDMNCVRTSDYTPDFVDKITKYRAKSHVEPPMDDVVNFLDSGDYTDAYRYFLWMKDGQKETYKESLTNPKFGVEFEERKKMATCWAGTRIDHFWISKSLMEKIDLVEYSVCKEEISDHFMVLLDAKFR